MKGWRFYEEYKTEKRKVPTGNVIAVDTTQRPYPIFSFGVNGVGRDVRYERGCVSAVFCEPNSPVCCSSASIHYTQVLCKRISEAKARTIHPKLFEYLEME